MKNRRNLWVFLLSLILMLAIGVASAYAVPSLQAPTNLTTTPDSAQITLAWTAVSDAASYTVKRAVAPGGTYTEIASNLTATSYTDKGLTNGTTYYYIVTAVSAKGESANSSEISATPQVSGNGMLIITVSGTARVYNMTMAQIQAFIDWYGNRTTGGNTYVIETPAPAPYKKVKDYLIFDKIVTWQVREY